MKVTSPVRIPSDHDLLRYSLIFVWLVTALVSVIELHGQSAELLHGIRGVDPSSGTLLILGGACVDVVLGLALWFKPKWLTYMAALMIMLAMTLLATVWAPQWWLNPLGPLTKNVPIAVVLMVLARRTS